MCVRVGRGIRGFAARGGKEVVECEDGLGEVGKELPFLRAVDGGREGIVEVEPFVGSGGFA